MRRSIAAVLALYPRAIRERYGAEIGELLATSRRPARDLADVARAALRERLLAVIRADPRAALRRIPNRVVVFLVAILAVVLVAVAFVVLPVAIGPLGFAAGLWVAGRESRSWTARALTAGLLALFVSPHLAQLLAGWSERISEVAATAAFLVAAVGLATLPIRSGRRRTALVAAIGLLALPFAATTMFVWFSGSGLPEPWLAYGMSMLPYGRWSDQWLLEDALVYYPVLYTWCAWFLAACCLRAVTRPAVVSSSGRP